MILQLTPFAIIYLVTIAIGLYLFHLAKDIPFTPGRKLVRLVIVGTIILNGMYVLQLLVIDPGVFLISILIGIMGIYMIISALLLFALSYTGREQYVNPRAFVLLMVPPLLILSAVATNQYFSLFVTGQLYL
ncbi:histidine kinase N-terminal 7TM domain-containing protein [Methanocalculus taiwanensis]|nr:histidine kinase N-terminal 7TM domain-containing protein [Methanocalculus taiwanensis]